MSSAVSPAWPAAPDSGGTTPPGSADGDMPPVLAISAPATATPTATAPRARKLSFGLLGDVPNSVMHTIVVHQTRVWAWGLALALGTLPVTLLAAYVANRAVDAAVEQGDVDVRYPLEEIPRGTWVWWFRVVWMVMFSVVWLASLGVYYAGQIRNLGHEPTRRYWLAVLATAVISPFLSGLRRFFGIPRMVRTVSTLLGTFILASLMCREVGRIAGSRLLGHLLLLSGAATMMTFLFYRWWVGAFYASQASDWGGDAVRLLILCVLQPLLQEFFSMPTRAIAYLARGRDTAVALGGLWYHLSTLHLVRRWMLSDLRTVEGQAVALVFTALTDVFMRRSMARRDSRLAPANDRAATHRVSALARNVDESCDAFATFATAVMILTLRNGPDRDAPSAVGTLQFLALQIVAEVLVDLGVGFAGVALARRGSRPGRRYVASVLERSWGLRAWTLRYWLFTLLAVHAGVVYVLYNFVDIDLGDEAWSCAWSSHDGWWHRVPCARSGEWLGLV